METLDLIAIGEIVKAQGLYGQLKVVPLTDNPDRFGELRRVYWQKADGYQELFIENYQIFKGCALLKFSGINDITAANLLGRGLIYIPRSERLKLPEGRYYHDQIIGLKVFTSQGELLGTIDQILETGSNDVYSVRNAARQILIPALKSVVKEVNLEQGQMVVELPPGLVEDEA
jgi:16S rRNA processing protein RimM